VKALTEKERTELIDSYLGRLVHIEIDRPVGYIHKKENYSLTYPINYGYIPDVFGGDGEELDVYLLGVNEPVKEYTARVIGAAYRKNDIEDKLIAAPVGMSFTEEEAYEAIKFQEQWYDIEVKIIDTKGIPHFTVGTKENAEYYHRPGAYLIPVRDGKVGLIKTGGYCFMGGGRDKGENDYECLKREVIEETGCSAEIGEYIGSAEQYKDNQTCIGYFHPVQNYYTGTLGEKICEPIEPDHELQWVNPEEAFGKFFIEMQEKALKYFWEKYNENNPR